VFHCQDLRQDLIILQQRPRFHLICCRNLAFTYFDETLQNQVAQKLHNDLVDGGVLMIGVHEALPSGAIGFTTWNKRLGIYRNE
jgi:chemotaxis protein methyltransferase CheR